jgi:hypothetical protein
MRPIVFESVEELQCLSNFTNCKCPKEKGHNYSIQNVANWKFNFNYWTGGIQRDCKGQWSWCSGSEASKVVNNLTWSLGQPDNKNGGDDCLQMRILQNETGIALSDRNCSDRYVIACEVLLII